MQAVTITQITPDEQWLKKNNKNTEVANKETNQNLAEEYTIDAQLKLMEIENK